MNSTTSLAELATTHPGASRVFHRFGLDFCCGGRRPLQDACEARGIDPATVLNEIARETDGASGERWDVRPIPDVVAYIVDHYHARLRDELPQLIALAAKVEARHGDKPTCPNGLRAHIQNIHGAVLDHLEKEEEILFPMILRGLGQMAAAPIRMMEIEHDDHRENLLRTRELTANLTPPPEACTSWQALYLRLEALEQELMEHIHLENNVLFPRILGDAAEDEE